VSGHLDSAAVAALLCALGGLLVPLLVARLPEPAPDPAHADEGPKETYAAIAALPRLRTGVVLAAGVAGGLVGLATGWTWDLLLLLPLVPVGVALAVVDWRTRLLPSRVVLPATGVALLLVGVLWLLERDTDALVRALVGLVVARSFFWLLWRIRSSGMGFGDVRLAALLGLALAHLGWAELVVGLYAGFLVFAVPGLVLAVLRRDREVLRTAYPFGPFLLIGALVGVVTGPLLWASLVTG